MPTGIYDLFCHRERHPIGDGFRFETPEPMQRKPVMMSYSPTLRTIVSEDGAAILDIERNSISTLNPTGAFVWQGLQRGERLEVIIANLADETGENVAVVERDVQAFIQDLQQKHLAAR